VKKLILLPFLFIATNSFANELHNFSEVKSAITMGKSIHIVTDFAKCSSSKKEAFQATQIGAFTPNEIQVVDTHIATSFMHFTLNNPSFPNVSIYEFARYTITDDNNLNLSYQALDARNYSPLTEKASFNCKMNVGVKIYD
jgi:hypothetical protein